MNGFIKLTFTPSKVIPISYVNLYSLYLTICISSDPAIILFFNLDIYLLGWGQNNMPYKKLEIQQCRGVLPFYRFKRLSSWYCAYHTLFNSGIIFLYADTPYLQKKDIFIEGLVNFYERPCFVVMIHVKWCETRESKACYFWNGMVADM